MSIDIDNIDVDVHISIDIIRIYSRVQKKLKTGTFRAYSDHRLQKVGMGLGRFLLVLFLL